jgi:hypothetical protein
MAHRRDENIRDDEDLIQDLDLDELFSEMDEMDKEGTEGGEATTTDDEEETAVETEDDKKAAAWERDAENADFEE